MVKANIGTVEITKDTVLIGKEHLITSYPVKDGQKNLNAGTAVVLKDGKLEHLAADTDDAIGILAESLEGTSKDSTANIVVFGAVKKERVTFTAANTACTEKLVESLRKNGVYALV